MSFNVDDREQTARAVLGAALLLLALTPLEAPFRAALFVLGVLTVCSAIPRPRLEGVLSRSRLLQAAFAPPRRPTARILPFAPRGQASAARRAAGSYRA